MALNSEQAHTKSEILKGGYHLLLAKAGCGKSYLVGNIIVSHSDCNKRGAVSEFNTSETTTTIVAPSHTARSVIESEIIKQGGSINTVIASMTVAAAIGKRPDFNTAPTSFKDTPYIINVDSGLLLGAFKKDKVNLLIIEEISMVSRADLSIILKLWAEVAEENDIVLMVGDYKQIKPVNGRSSRGLLAEMYNNGDVSRHKLTVNMRSDNDTDIPAFSDSVYDNYEGDYSNYHMGITLYNSYSSFLFEYANYIDSNNGQTTAIAYTNKQVNAYLETGVDSLFVNFKPGNLIRLHEGISANFKNSDDQWVDITLANNGDIVTVLSYSQPIPAVQVGNIDNDDWMSDISNSDDCLYQHPWVKDKSILYGVITLDIRNPDLKFFGEYINLMVPHKINGGSNGGKKGEYGLLFDGLLNVVSKISKSLDQTIGKADNPKIIKLIKELTVSRFDLGVERIWNNYNDKFEEGTTYCTKRKKALLLARCFYGERSKFTNLTSLDSVTAHKAQGQSIDFVFADLRNISKADDDLRNNLAYVACSRAIKQLHVLY